MPFNLQLLKGSIIAFFTENFPPNFLVPALHWQKAECSDEQGKWSKIYQSWEKMKKNPSVGEFLERYQLFWQWQANKAKYNFFPGVSSPFVPNLTNL